MAQQETLSARIRRESAEKHEDALLARQAKAREQQAENTQIQHLLKAFKSRGLDPDSLEIEYPRNDATWRRLREAWQHNMIDLGICKIEQFKQFSNVFKPAADVKVIRHRSTYGAELALRGVAVDDLPKALYNRPCGYDYEVQLCCTPAAHDMDIVREQRLPLMASIFAKHGQPVRDGSNDNTWFLKPFVSKVFPTVSIYVRTLALRVNPFIQLDGANQHDLMQTLNSILLPQNQIELPPAPPQRQYGQQRTR